MAKTDEEKKAYQREWRLKNPEKVKAKQRRYRERNREKIWTQDAERARRRRVDPVWNERIKEQRRLRWHSEEYRAKRKVKRDEWVRKKLEENPDYFRRKRDLEKERWLAKKVLCACGCGEIVKTPGRTWAGPGHCMRGKENPDAIKAQASPTMLDIGWIAGFLEGEGTFWLKRGGNSGRVACRQVQREPLERLQRFLGGPIRLNKKFQDPRRYFENSKASHDWWVTGVRARGVMMTLYSFMSPRRKEQILKVLGGNKWASSNTGET